MQLIEQQNETYPLLPQLDYARRWLDGFISILESYIVRPFMGMFFSGLF